jgi:hypothetical protein
MHLFRTGSSDLYFSKRGFSAKDTIAGGDVGLFADAVEGNPVGPFLVTDSTVGPSDMSIFFHFTKISVAIFVDFLSALSDLRILLRSTPIFVF